MCKPVCGSVAGVLCWQAGDRKLNPIPTQIHNYQSSNSISFTRFLYDHGCLSHRSSLAATTQIPQSRRSEETRSSPVPRTFLLINSRQVPEEPTQHLAPNLRFHLLCALFAWKVQHHELHFEDQKSTCSNTWLVNSQLLHMMWPEASQAKLSILIQLFQVFHFAKAS